MKFNFFSFYISTSKIMSNLQPWLIFLDKDLISTRRRFDQQKGCVNYEETLKKLKKTVIELKSKKVLQLHIGWRIVANLKLSDEVGEKDSSYEKSLWIWRMNKSPLPFPETVCPNGFWLASFFKCLYYLGCITLMMDKI